MLVEQALPLSCHKGTRGLWLQTVPLDCLLNASPQLSYTPKTTIKSNTLNLLLYNIKIILFCQCFGAKKSRFFTSTLFCYIYSALTSFLLRFLNIRERKRIIFITIKKPTKIISVKIGSLGASFASSISGKPNTIAGSC